MIFYHLDFLIGGSNRKNEHGFCYWNYSFILKENLDRDIIT